MVSELLKSALSSGEKLLAVLVDPDDCNTDYISALKSSSDFFDLVLFGGSLLSEEGYEEKLRLLKIQIKKPIVIFPGDPTQVSSEADSILLLSLISGRNPELLIGKHVTAAIPLKRSGLEIIPTGYVLVDGGAPTSVTYISNTLPIPKDKAGIAASTALAGEQLGLKAIYLEAGSGAVNHVPVEMVGAVRKMVSLPLIVGGGIRSAQSAASLYEAGADMLVIGNGARNYPGLIEEIYKVKKKKK